MNVCFLTLVLLFSCSENTDNESNLFLGKWQVISVAGGFSPTETFQEDEIIWDFYSNDSLEITINIIVSNTSKLPIKNDTTLLYSYDTNNILLIGSFEYEYRIEENSLKLFDNFASDGIMIELERY